MDDSSPYSKVTTAFGFLLSFGLIMVVGYWIDLANRGAQAWNREAERARAVTADWPDIAQSTARYMIDRQGPPDWISGDRLVWLRREPWKRVIVSRYPNFSPLEHVVRYRVAERMLPAVSAFNHGIRVDRGLGELSARSDRESLNCLSLNLAWEVAEGRRTTEEARDFFLRTATLGASGKSSPYLEGLIFTPNGRKPARKWELPSEGAYRGLSAP